MYHRIAVIWAEPLAPSLENGVSRQPDSCVVLYADSAVTALGTGIAAGGLFVTLERGLIAAVRVGKAFAAELGFFKKSQKVNELCLLPKFMIQGCRNPRLTLFFFKIQKDTSYTIQG
jgi:hypothetical protein